MINDILGEKYLYPKIKEIVLEVQNFTKSGKVILIVGQPGSGKSVFMKQLYEELKSKIECLIAIRAEFLKESDSPEKVFDIFKKVENEDKPKVLLLDSLDVLAYSHRRELQEWLYYVDKMKDIKEMTVVCASRSFEANHLYPMNEQTWSEKINIEPLPDDFIDKVLTKLSYDFNFIPIRFREFLKIPLHLRVAADIILKGGDLKNITDIESLYTKLLEVLGISPDEIKILSYMAELMIENRSIYLFYPSINAQMQKIIKEVERPGITGIIQFDDQNGAISFSHQTFIDYFTAIKVINEQKSIKNFILEHNQSLFIRPVLRHIVAILRLTSQKRLFKELEEIFFEETKTEQVGFISSSSKINLHIKTAILADIASWDNPTSDEANFLIRIFNDENNGDTFTVQFFDKKPNIDWYFVLKDKYIIPLITSSNDADIKYIFILSFLSEIVKQIPSKVLEILRILLIKKPDNMIEWFFFKISKDISEIKLDESIQDSYADSLEQVVKKGFITDSIGTLQVLEVLAKFSPKRALNLYFENLKKELQERKDSHPQRDLLDAFADVLSLVYGKIPYETLFTTTDFFEQIFSENYLNDKLWDFPSIMLYDEYEQRFGLEAFYEWYKENFLEFCSKLTEQSKSLIEKLNNSKWKTQRQLSMLCKLKNPDVFKEEITKCIEEIISTNLQGSLIYEKSDLFLKSIERIFPVISSNEREAIIEKILTLYLDDKNQVFDWIWTPLNHIPEKFRTNTVRSKLKEIQNKYNLPDYDYQPPKKLGEAKFAEAPYKADFLEGKEPADLYKFLIENRSLEERWDFENDKYYGGVELLAREAATLFVDNLTKYKSVVEELSKDSKNDVYLSNLFSKLGEKGINEKETSWLINLVESVCKRETLQLEIIRALRKSVKFVTKECFDKLKNILLTLSNAKDPEKDKFIEYRKQGYANDVLTEGINSTRGELAELVLLLTQRFQEDWLIEILQKLSNDKTISVRAALIYYLPLGLKSLGWDECLELFSNAFEASSDEYGRIITDFLQYTPKEKYGNLSGSITKMRSTMQSELGIEYAKLTTIFYLRGMVSQEDLLKLLEDKKLNKKGLDESVKLLAMQLQYEEAVSKCLKILIKLMEKESISSESIHFIFLKARPDDFNNFVPILRKVIENKRTQVEDLYYLLEYLEKSLLKDPLKNFELLENMLEKLIEDFYEHKGYSHAFYSKAPINIINTILECYPEQEQRALKALDSLIKLKWSGVDEYLSEFERM